VRRVVAKYYLIGAIIVLSLTWAMSYYGIIFPSIIEGVPFSSSLEEVKQALLGSMSPIDVVIGFLLLFAVYGAMAYICVWIFKGAVHVTKGIIAMVKQ
jgi:hypothetical protein